MTGLLDVEAELLRVRGLQSVSPPAPALNLSRGPTHRVDHRQHHVLLSGWAMRSSRSRACRGRPIIVVTLLDSRHERRHGIRYVACMWHDLRQ